MDCKRIRVLIAEDHTLVAAGLEALLKDTFDLVGIVNDGRQLLESTELLKPDVIVTDITMPQLNGIDAIRQIHSRFPAMRIIALTMHRDTQLAVEALRGGAAGYMLKVSPAEELLTAIREVAQGRTYITTLLSGDLISVLLAGGQPADNSSLLSIRQREVLQLIAEGLTMKEVATTLQISPRTAESHKYEIMEILGLTTTAELIRYAIRTGLVGE